MEQDILFCPNLSSYFVVLFFVFVHRAEMDDNRKLMKAVTLAAENPELVTAAGQV